MGCCSSQPSHPPKEDVTIKAKTPAPAPAPAKQVKAKDNLSLPDVSFFCAENSVLAQVRDSQVKLIEIPGKKAFAEQCASVIHKHILYIVGGVDKRNKQYNVNDFYQVDTSGGEVKTLTAANFAVKSGNLHGLGDSLILAGALAEASDDSISLNEGPAPLLQYRISTNEWSILLDPTEFDQNSSSRLMHPVCLIRPSTCLYERGVVVVGGYYNSGGRSHGNSKIYLIDLDDVKNFQELSTKLSPAVSQPHLAIGHGGKLFILGGTQFDENATKSKKHQVVKLEEDKLELLEEYQHIPTSNVGGVVTGEWVVYFGYPYILFYNTKNNKFSPRSLVKAKHFTSLNLELKLHDSASSIALSDSNSSDGGKKTKGGVKSTAGVDANVKVGGKTSMSMPIASSKGEVKAHKDGVKAPKDEVKAPKDGVKAPKDGVKAPRDEVKATRDEVKAPKAEVKGHKFGAEVKVSKVKSEADLKAPKAKVEVKAPKDEVKAEASKFGLKKGGVSSSSSDDDHKGKVPKVKADVKAPKTEIKAPKVDVKTPKVNIKVEVNAPNAEVKVSAPKHGYKAGAERSLSSSSDDGPKGKAGLSVGVKAPSIKPNVKASKTEIKAPKADIKASKAEVKVESPKFGFKRGGKRSSSSSSDEGHFGANIGVKAPIHKTDVKAPKAENKAPKAEVRAPKAEVKAPKFGFKRGVKNSSSSSSDDGHFGANIGMKAPKAEDNTPKVDIKVEVNAPKPEIKVSAPKLGNKAGAERFSSSSSDERPKDKAGMSVGVKAPLFKADVKVHKVEVKAPKADVKVEAPKFGVKKSSNSNSDDGPKPGFSVGAKALKADVKAPKTEIKAPKAEIKAPIKVEAHKFGFKAGGKRSSSSSSDEGHFEANIGVKAPIHKTDVKAPMAENKAPKAEIKAPKADAKVEPPKIGFKAGVKKSSNSSSDDGHKAGGVVKSPTVKTDVKVPTVKAEVKAPKAENKAPKAEVRAPKAEIKAPKFGFKRGVKNSSSSSSDDGQFGANIGMKAPQVDDKTPKVDIKVEVNAPKPEVKVSAPKLGTKAGAERFSSSSSDDVPRGKAGMSVGAKAPSIKADVKAPKVEVKGGAGIKAGFVAKRGDSSSSSNDDNLGSIKVTVKAPKADVKVAGAQLSAKGSRPKA
jgi:hypothetical protein